MPPLQVTCGIIIYKDKILATRRGPAQAQPLKWEFPGGKLEDGEPPEAALLRELVEELDFRVRITGRMDPVPYAGSGQDLELIPFICEPDQAHAPHPLEHSEIRWITPEQADHLDWAPADVPLVEQLPDLLPSVID